MKKHILTLVIIIFVIILAFTLTGCSNVKDNRQLADFIDVYIQKGFSVDASQKPLFPLIGAIDGVIFYAGNSPVKIYQYKDEKSYNEALKQYPIIENFDKNGLFLLESSKEDIKEIFKSI